HGQRKRFDCANQRTGQPRWAQLIANTWNFRSSTRRTQQGMSAVLPSEGLTTGLRNATIRVSPTGNWLSGPSEIQSSALAGLRVGDLRYLTTGTASTAATTPLKMSPMRANAERLAMGSPLTTCSPLPLP